VIARRRPAQPVWAVWNPDNGLAICRPENSFRSRKVRVSDVQPAWQHARMSRRASESGTRFERVCEEPPHSFVDPRSIIVGLVEVSARAPAFRGTHPLSAESAIPMKTMKVWNALASNRTFRASPNRANDVPGNISLSIHEASPRLPSGNRGWVQEIQPARNNHVWHNA